jgi:vacuolar-type H+-ATPase subunit C/Vma6
MTDWSDVVARARGLTSQLLPPAQWRELCQAADIPAVAARLSTGGWHLAPSGAAPATPGAIELAVRRRAGARLRLLARWAGSRVARLTPLFDDEDRRSLRAIVRGAAAGVPAQERLWGLVPTPALPLRALAQLARAADVAEVAAQLTAWRHPLAQGFSVDVRGPHPDLFKLDVAMTRAFARRAGAAARRADAPMRLFVQRTVDLENFWTALALAEGPADVVPAELLAPGGSLVREDDLRAAAGARSPAALAAALRRRVVGTPIAAALDPDGRAREDRALEAMVAEFRRIALTAPLSTAPIVGFVLRQRLEVRRLLHIVWGIALGAPRRTIETAVGIAA